MTALRVGLAEAAAILRAGGIVAYPTETFYGLGALATCAPALERLAHAKLRPEGKPLPLIAGDLAQVAAVASLAHPAAQALARRFWPGPLTLVLPAAADLAQAILAGGVTVGVRVPGLALARELALAAGGALVSTSANPSGGPPPTRPEALDPALAGRIDAVLDGGETPGGFPSTLVALEGGRPRLVRAGAVPFADVEAALLPTSPASR